MEALMATREHIEGRSESLNKTITEVMKFLGDNATSRPGGWGAKLRPFLHEKLADLAEHWYKRGIRRGHIECHKEFKATGSLSRRLRYSANREFFAGQQRSVRVTSKIKRKSRAR
jgi:hypothetical protein